MLIRLSSLCAVMSIAGAAAQAQPAASVDCGTVAEIGAMLSSEASLAAGETRWFHIRLASPIAADRNWLEIDTAPSAIGHTVAAVYDSHGRRVGLSRHTVSALPAAFSFGGGSGQQLVLDRIPGMPGTMSSPAIPGGRGLISDGADGGVLAAGDYYIAVGGAVGGADSTDTASIFPAMLTNWNIATTSTEASAVKLRIAAGRTPASTWNKRYRGYPVASPFSDTYRRLTTDAAHVIVGAGPLTQITSTFRAGTPDLFKVRIDDPYNFRVIATVTSSANTEEGGSGANLFLLDSSGRGVCAITSSTTGPTTLTALPGLTAGEYYIGVSSNCKGLYYQNAGPHDTASVSMFDFRVKNAVLRPDPRAGAIGYFGLQSTECSGGGDLSVRLSLTGVAYVSDSATTSEAQLGNTSQFFRFIDEVSGFGDGC